MTNSNDEFRIFRIRLKDADAKDHAKTAWENGQVGVWYGAWKQEDLKEAIERYKEKGVEEAVKYMTDTPAQKKLGWEYSKSYFHTCWRFMDITEKQDWVLVYFEEKLCLGQLDGDIEIEDGHELNKNRELFHFRKLIGKKEFPLAELPDSYKLLAQAGRSNVHEHNDTYAEMLKILVKKSDSREVKEHYASLSVDKWLEFLSPTEWESLCLGYLIIEYDYVPTGLLPGRTLQHYDLVGKTREGIGILAQCKNSRNPYNVEDFLTPYKNYKGSDKILWFWFSYGGAESSDPRIKIVDKDHIKKWLDTEDGKKYLDVFRG